MNLLMKEIFFSASNIIQEPKKPEKQKILNVSLASVSESIKSKMMPTNNLGKLKKFNISKTLSIKAFLTPKQVKCKPKVIKETEVDSKKMEDLPKQSDIDTVKKATKPAKNPKSINNVATEVKKMEPKKTNTINGELNSSKTTKSQPKVKAKTAKPQSLNSKPNNKTAANKSMSGRTVRTPKRKACCDDSHDQDKSLKSSGSKSKQKMSPSAKKPKLVDSSSIKSKAAKNINDSTSQKTVKKQSAKKMNDSIAKKPQTKASKNNKTEQEVEQPKSVEEAPMNRTLSNARKGQTKASKNNKTVVHEVDQPKSVEVAPMNRTLRSRRIDLSSSINSSSENVTLQIRSLRTRRVDLSNSLKNSSLDETIKKGSKSKVANSKTAKTNHTEVPNKKPRSVKNLR